MFTPFLVRPFTETFIEFRSGSPLRAGLTLIGNDSISAGAEAAHAKARAAYQDFLTLWKEADPDIPILKQAKAEYAKLQ